MVECQSKMGFMLMPRGNRSEFLTVRVRLTPESLIVQQEEEVYTLSRNPKTSSLKGSSSSLKGPENEKKRVIKLVRDKASGLGLSIKGGSDHRLPIVISKIYKDQAADQCGQLFVGDVIVKVNEVNVEHAVHEHAVRVLKEAGQVVSLTVKHFKTLSPFFQQAILEENNEESVEEQCVDQAGTGSESSGFDDADSAENAVATVEKKWSDSITIPLLLASLSRYKGAEDNIRDLGIEVCSMDNESKVVLYGHTKGELFSWFDAIRTNITLQNDQVISLSNYGFPPTDQIRVLDWVWERLASTMHWHAWQRKVLAVKGLELYIFDKPPVGTRDWLRSEHCYQLIEITCRLHQNKEDLLDRRKHCFSIKCINGHIHYLNLGTDSYGDVVDMINQIQRASNAAVEHVESRTFPGTWNGQNIKLTIDLKRGIKLFRAADRTLLWHYKFSQLKNSSDDGKSQITLTFSPSPDAPQEIQELVFGNMQQVLMVLQSFFAAKVSQVDPQYVLHQ